MARGRYELAGRGLVYLADNDGRLLGAGWHVTDAFGDGLQRYWIDAASHAAVVGYDDGEDGSGNWAHYTTSAGYVLRGARTDGDGTRRYADNDGRLLERGWLVTDGFGQGLQRYWFEGYAPASEGYHETGAGSATYVTSAGYVLRGRLARGSLVYLADNDGRLAGGTAGGWVVSDAYGQGLQRYWVDAKAHAAVVGYDDGASGDGNWAHYTTSAGYVLRGAGSYSDGKFLADNDGLLSRDGWLVTDGFGQGLQRYWLVDGKAQASRFIDAGGGWWAYAQADGTVLRGARSVDGRVYVANNDGRLAYVSSPGWLVSADYGSGLQRYWLVPVSDTGYAYAKSGFFQADVTGHKNAWFYGDTSKGYVVRGRTNIAGKGLLISNNEGVLAESLTTLKPGWMVTSKFDGGLQRYDIVKEDGHFFAKTGVFTLGSDRYYGDESQGYLARGKYRHGSGMIVADNEGKLLWADDGSWVVTAAYDGALQRYYFVTIGKDASGNDIRGAKLGLFKVGNDSYYGRDDQGYVVRGRWVAPNGRAYYGDNDGKLGYPWLSEVGRRAWQRIMNVWSPTRYLLAVDCDNCHVIVFEGSQGNWVPADPFGDGSGGDWLCGTGLRKYNNGQGTIRGTYSMGGNGAYCNWASDQDYSEYGKPYDWQTRYFAKDDIRWYSNFCLDLGFHSTIGWEGGYSDPNQIGRQISHGCIRLLEKNAQWIYFNATYGTTVVTF